MYAGLISMVIAGLILLIAIVCGVEGDSPLPVANEIQAVDIFHRDDCACDDCYLDEVYCEVADEFTAYFNALEFKRAKNGASMIRRPGDKSFKFVAKA